MKYRTRTEIVAGILEAANSGATKTNIMYKAFLSHSQLRDYLALLIDNELLEHMAGGQMYKTTPRGLNLLKMYNDMTKLLPGTPVASRISPTRTRIF